MNGQLEISLGTHAKQLENTIHIMHIVDKLSVSGSGIHGVSKALERWIPCFNSNQFRFSVCSLRAPEAAGDIFKNQGVPVFFLNRSKFDPRTLLALLRLIHREKPNILHLHGYGATNFGRLASLLSRTPNILHEHTIIDDQPFYQTIADFLLSPLTTKALAVSKPVSNFMIRQRKVKSSQLETLVIGLPLKAFQAPSSEIVTQLRLNLGIRPNEQVVCTVGRLDTQKGQIYLLEAADQILKNRPQTRFLIVGDGPDRASLEAETQRRGIRDRVIFTGLRNDVPALLALADVVAIPSLWEGGPLTLFEAMNLSKPIVCTPVGVIEDVVQDGVSASLVPIKNSEKLAEKLTLLLEDPELSKKMGEMAWQVCQHYDLHYSAQRLSDIYYDLVV